MRNRMIHAGILAAFILMPIWYRLPVELISTDLYAVRFGLFGAALWTIGWWLLAKMPGLGEFRREPNRVVWALALVGLALLALASNLWAFQRIDHPEVGMSNAVQMLASVGFALVVACAAPPRRHIITALVIGLVGHTLIALLQVSNQGSIGLDMLGERVFDVGIAGVSVVQAGDVRWIRPYGLLPHPNILAGFLVVSLLAAGAWVLAQRTVVWWIGTSVFLLGLLGLLLTFSRAAWIGFAAGALVVGLVLLRTRVQFIRIETLITAGCVILVGVVFFSIFRPFLLARTGAVSESIEQRSVAGRVVYTAFALQAITEFPVLGVGIGNFPWRASYYLMDIAFDMRGDSAHNIYLSAWAELGTVGLVVFVVMLIAGGLAFWKMIVSTSPPTRSALPSTSGWGNEKDEWVARVVLFGGFVALAIIGLFDHYPWTQLQSQMLWWGGLAAAIGVQTQPGSGGASIMGNAPQSPSQNTISERTHMPSASRHQIAPSEPIARASALAD